MVIDFKAVREKASQPAAPVGGAQFTPGPWEHKGNRVYRKDSYEVAWIAGDGPHSEWQANGKLIAAAPAMYEALSKIAELRQQWRDDVIDSMEYMDELDALNFGALSQAEGR